MLNKDQPALFVALLSEKTRVLFVFHCSAPVVRVPALLEPRAIFPFTVTGPRMVPVPARVPAASTVTRPMDSSVPFTCRVPAATSVVLV